MGACLSRNQSEGAFFQNGTSRKKDWVSIYSEEGSDKASSAPLKVTVVNESNELLTYCWIEFRTGKLFHYMPVHPLGSINDGSVSNKSIQHTQAGHAFIVYATSQHVGNSKPTHVGDVTEEAFRTLYRVSPGNDKDEDHVITIASQKKCGLKILKKCERKLINNASKEYFDQAPAGKGFHLFCDAGVTKESVEVLIRDLEEVDKLLPPHALELLQKDTPFYINSTLVYGFEDDPTIGKGSMFHPAGSAAWLKENGLSTSHEGSIELMNVDNYCHDRVCWGRGGLLLHELSHAYHNKHLQDGYNNETVMNLYDAAMKEHRYDHCIAKYGEGDYSQPMRGYCASDCMEFFAELSVAFMWQEDSEMEFNKWTPRNGPQLKAWDPASYDGIAALWAAP